MTKFRNPDNISQKDPKKLNPWKSTNLIQCGPNPPNCWIWPAPTDDPTRRIRLVFQVSVGQFFSDSIQSGWVRVWPKPGLTRPDPWTAHESYLLLTNHNRSTRHRFCTQKKEKKKQNKKKKNQKKKKQKQKTKKKKRKKY